MHSLITFEQMVHPFYGNPELTNVIHTNCAITLSLVNQACMLAEADGVPLQDDPDTACALSGSAGNKGGGGWCPTSMARAATHSQHYQGNAIDRFDPLRLLMRWCLLHSRHLVQLGLYLEHPQWTPTWVHFQRIPPGSRNRWFVPYGDLIKYPPRISALPEQAGVMVRQFAVN